jgi:small conductance mechanosensitive channel
MTFDNKLVTAPNGKIQDSNIINYSRLGTLRADVNVQVSYKDDLRQVKQTLLDILAADERVLPDPPATVVILDFGADGINVGVRPFVKLDDYWNIQFDLRERIKERFDEVGITIPFPQRDVHLIQAKNE